MIVVIPCYNEEKRLDPSCVAQLVADPRVDVILVDDGSTDGTAELLAELSRRHSGRVEARTMPRNGGKAEAVRTSFLRAFERIDAGETHRSIAYLDADFATPPSELVRMLDCIEQSGAKVVLGARIARLGAEVVRKPSRHYLGRLFATAASFVLGVSIYDTQCGAKIFADTPALRAAMIEPFRSAWVFDVELLGRLLTGTSSARALGPGDFVEVPLRAWHDVRGSKLGVKGALRGGVDLLRLGASVHRGGRDAFFRER